MNEQAVSILIAADDPGESGLLAKTLAVAGYRRVETVTGGAAALAALERETFPIVIASAEADGCGLCRAIRARGEAAYVYVLILARGRRRSHILEALAAGADAVLARPVDPAELSARVAAAQRIVDRERSLRLTNEEVRALSIRDPLTGVFNRVYLMERLPQELKRSRRYGRPLSLIMCDIDHFKAVNDRHGHGAGDRVLRDFAGRLAGSIRIDVDWMARYGGEEFLIVLPETDLSPACVVAERLRRLVAESPFGLRDGGVRITASFGVASYRPTLQAGRVTFDELMERADAFLYQAKRAGRNTVRGEESRDAEAKGCRAS
ncbi:MAG: diguanylate cyclase [Syntrophaceae bacterium]|nr:diguanylate cyclase [Syntrophaceae bacterium]